MSWPNTWSAEDVDPDDHLGEPEDDQDIDFDHEDDDPAE